MRFRSEYDKMYIVSKRRDRNAAYENFFALCIRDALRVLSVASVIAERSRRNHSASCDPSGSMSFVCSDPCVMAVLFVPAVFLFFDKNDLIYVAAYAVTTLAGCLIGTFLSGKKT